MKTIIIGAGLSSLSASLRVEKPLIIEKSHEIGGLLSSYKSLNIEKFYHHFFEFDEELLSLLRTLRLMSRVRWYEVKTGFLVNGRIHPMNTPLEILRYPHLSFREKIRLALLTRECRRMMRERTLLREMDEVDARSWIIEKCGEDLYEKFFRPMIEKKFGKDSERISASWLIGRVGMRSSRTLRGERVGYLKGGLSTLIDALLERTDAEVLTGTQATSLEISGGKKIIKTSRGTFECEKLLITAPELVSKVRWQKTSCALIATDEPLMEDIYWLNVYESSPIGAVIEHTNMVSPEEYGCHLTYLVSYTHVLSEEIVRKFIEKYFGVRKMRVIGIENSNYTAPIYETGYFKKIIPYERDGIYYAGMFSEENYPERSMNGSLLAGKKAAELMG